MIPGKKMCAIFGFCDVRGFAVCTEVLKQDVMIFVNEIAVIVHSCVDKYAGSCNKNIGDAWLLVWKIPSSETFNGQDDKGKPQLLIKQNSLIVNNFADLALASLLKIWATVSKSYKLEKYRSHPDLLKVNPDFYVNMGFGLHQGWAIEGAIGSQYKIDASYLSPNVNMSSRLEAATRQFKCRFLVSDKLHLLLSDTLKSYCRCVDKVTVKGSVHPMSLYTIDVDISSLNRQ
jgi:class 3 adenylate cyclase